MRKFHFFSLKFRPILCLHLQYTFLLLEIPYYARTKIDNLVVSYSDSKTNKNYSKKKLINDFKLNYSFIWLIVWLNDWPIDYKRWLLMVKMVSHFLSSFCSSLRKASLIKFWPSFSTKLVLSWYYVHCTPVVWTQEVIVCLHCIQPKIVEQIEFLFLLSDNDF